MCRSNVQNPIHRIYLLTIWQEEDHQEVDENWRFLVEDPRSGRRRGFAGVAALVEDLLAMVAALLQPPSPLDDKDS